MRIDEDVLTVGEEHNRDNTGREYDVNGDARRELDDSPDDLLCSAEHFYL